MGPRLLLGCVDDQGRAVLVAPRRPADGALFETGAVPVRVRTGEVAPAGELGEVAVAQVQLTVARRSPTPLRVVLRLYVDDDPLARWERVLDVPPTPSGAPLLWRTTHDVAVRTDTGQMPRGTRLSLEAEAYVPAEAEAVTLDMVAVVVEPVAALARARPGGVA